MSAKWWSRQLQTLIPPKQQKRESETVRTNFVRALENKRFTPSDVMPYWEKSLKTVWHLYLPLPLPLPHPFLSLAAVLKTASHIIRVGLWPLVPGEQSRPYSQIIMFVCPNLSRGHLGQLTQGAHLQFACLGTYSGWKSVRHCLKIW